MTEITAAAHSTLPLLPLERVLFPGKQLVLRVTDASGRHYRELVRECGRRGTGIGICLMLPAADTTRPAAPAAFGTEAKIEDFRLEHGALDLHVRGARRFRVLHTRVRDNGLLLGEVEFKPEPAPRPLPPQYAVLSDLLRVMANLKDHPISELVDASQRDWEDAHWVSWRFCNTVPLAEVQRQGLLEEDDVEVRLQRLLERVDDIAQGDWP